MLKTAGNCGVSTVAVHRWSSIISCRGAEADSPGPPETLQLLYIDKVVDVLVVPVQFSSAVVEETAELPQLQFLVVWTGCCMPFGVQRLVVDVP